MDIMSLKPDALVAVILDKENGREKILTCLETLGNARISYGVHCLSQDEEIARQELDALATTAVKVIIVAAKVTDCSNHLQGQVAGHLTEEPIMVIGVALPESTVALQDVFVQSGTALVWATDAKTGAVSAAEVAAKIVAIQEKVTVG